MGVPFIPAPEAWPSATRPVGFTGGSASPWGREVLREMLFADEVTRRDQQAAL